MYKTLLKIITGYGYEGHQVACSRGKTFLGRLKKHQQPCGKVSVQQDNRGVRGIHTALYHFPWQTSRPQLSSTQQFTSLPKWSTLHHMVCLKGFLFVCDMALPAHVTVTNLVSWFSSVVPTLENMAASEPFNTTLLDWSQIHLKSKKHRLPRVNVKPCASRQQTRDLMCMQVYQFATMTRVNYKTLRKEKGCHNFIKTATCFQATSEPTLSYQHLPVNHRPKSSCSSSKIRLVKSK